MNVLITGGAGYIGTELVHALNENKRVDKIVIYDNLIRGNFNLFLGQSELGNKLRFVKGDILDSRKLKKELEGIDVVYHLAAKVTTPFADHNPHEFDQINNWGTAELTYQIEESGVSQLIYLSSLSVYGEGSGLRDVSSPLGSKTFYGISKMHGEEHVARLGSENLKVHILRVANVYGYCRSMRFDSVINKFMFEANYSNRIRIFGDGDQRRSFVHVDRLSEYLSGLVNSDSGAGTYNIVESSFSINEIVHELKGIYPKLDLIYVNQNMKMRSLNVNLDKRIEEFTLQGNDTLRKDLIDFKRNFSFH